MKDKKKLLVTIGIVLVSAFLVWFILYFAKRGFTPNARANYYNIENINYIKNYLKNNYDKNFPIPEGDVVFLDKNLKPVVVSNEKNALAQNQNIYVIQGNTCNINIGQGDYEKKKYDIRFSNDKVKKCFSYAVTRDRKYFQLGTILYKNWKYVAYLDGNFGGNITKDYQSQNMVKNEGDAFLPYYPGFNDTMYLQALVGDANLKVESDFTSYKFKKEKDGKIFLPIGKNLALNFEGKNFVYKVVYPNGNVQFVGPNDKSQLSFSIKKFKYDNINTQLLIKDFIGKLGNVFVSNGEESDNRIYDDKGFLYEIFLGNTNFLVDDQITAVFLTSGKTRYSKLNYEYIFDVKNDYRGLDKDGAYVDLTKNNLNQYLKTLFDFSVLINNNINNTVSFNVSDNKKLENNYLKYILENNKDISYTKSYLITGNNLKYSANIFKGYFAENFTSKFYDYVDRNEKSDFSIIDLFGGVCGNKNIISLSGITGFFKFDNVKNTVEIDKNIYNILPQDYIVFFYNPVAKLLGISYLDTKTGNILYESDLSKIQLDGKIPAGFVLICN